jgi:hypothetical protein
VVCERLSKTINDIHELHYAVNKEFSKKYTFARPSTYCDMVKKCLGRDFFVFLEDPMQEEHAAFYDKMRDTIFKQIKIEDIQKLELPSVSKKNEQLSEAKPEQPSAKRRRLSETLPQYQKSLLPEEKPSSSKSQSDNLSRIPAPSSDQTKYNEIILLDEIPVSSEKKGKTKRKR